jgi:hypothetical protein
VETLSDSNPWYIIRPKLELFNSSISTIRGTPKNPCTSIGFLTKHISDIDPYYRKGGFPLNFTLKIYGRN